MKIDDREFLAVYRPMEGTAWAIDKNGNFHEYREGELFGLVYSISLLATIDQPPPIEAIVKTVGDEEDAKEIRKFWIDSLKKEKKKKR